MECDGGRGVREMFLYSKCNGDVRVGGELGEVLIGPSIEPLVYTMV